ncbi:hypothetical protein RJ55_03195 [Drechmeria coniospora]|nr:hypothetical protein RJ55_03195 [Drechmeria coniospora]
MWVSVLFSSAGLALSRPRQPVPRAPGTGGASTDALWPTVCYPFVENGTMAPCVSISKIETACVANGTDDVALEAHGRCMCGGSFFDDWRGCQRCLLAHGFRSDRDNLYWANVLSVASEALCTGTPTAEFSAIFASAEANPDKAPLATTGDTKSVDSFPGRTDVSLYYTASVTQGPGSVPPSASGPPMVMTTAESGGGPIPTDVMTSWGSVPDASTTDLASNETAYTTTASSDSTVATACTDTSICAAATDGAGSRGAAMALAGAALVMAL